MSVEVLPWSEFGRFHREFYLPNRPVIIRGLREAQPRRIFEWSHAHLARAMQGRRVPILQTQTGFLSYERDTVEMGFDDFIEQTKRREGPYYYFKNPAGLLPEGEDDSDRVEELRPYIGKAVMRNLWVSGPGLTVGLHFDAAENFNVQLRGRKSFTLHPPGVHGYYPMPMFSQTAHISRVFRDGPDPDLSRFPNFDPQSALGVVLEEGDVLYVPAYWWHQVTALGEENVNLNFWWFPSVTKQLMHWNQALRGHVQLAIRYARFGNLQKAPRQTEAERG